MNPGDSKAREGIQNVERASGGEVEQDSANDTEEHEGISLDEVMQKNNNKVSLAVQLKLKYTLTIFFLGGH